MKSVMIFLAVAICGAAARTFNDGNNEIHAIGDTINRISNGNMATDFQFPYMVSIQNISLLSLDTRGHKCGGVMITLQHVLTAASCFFATQDGNIVSINHNELRVFSGSAVLTNDFLQDRIRFIANVTVHPEYLGYPALLNDIAIITLLVPFANSTVTPIALPDAGFVPADFTLCTVAGWGAVNYTTTASTQLAYTTKYIYNQNLCTNIYNSMPYISNVFSTMVCAASYDIISSGCTGDQGNALVCNGGLTGILFLTNDCTASSFPELYTRVANYTTWIQSITGGANTFRPDIILWAIFTLIQIITIKVIT